MMKNLGVRQYRIYILLGFALVIGAYASINALQNWNQERLYIAVVGPMTGKSQADGNDMVRGVSMYLDELNEAGGVNGRSVELLVYDDQNDKELARTVAQDIANNDKIVAVLGHMFSSTSIVGGEIYKEAGIPAITGSATAETVTAENDFYFRTIPNNHDQAAFLANYANRIMKEPVVSIIYDKDVFGTTLAQSFANTFQGLGGELRYSWHFDTQSPTLESDIEAIVHDLVRAEQGDPGLVFLAIHSAEAKDLIISMRRKGFHHDLMGPTALGNPRFAEKFVDLPEEQTQPGFFLDNLYTATPILFDVAGEDAQFFRDAYVDIYGMEPGLKAPSFYDAAKVALTAIERAGVSGQPQTIFSDRQKVQVALTNMNSPEAGVEGVTGHLFFNKVGDIVKPLSVGVFSKQHLISAMTQLQPVPDLKRVVDLQAELDAGRILIVDGHHMYRTNVVYTGLDINEVSQVDTKKSSYTMDFYLWFRYQGDFDETNIEFMNSESTIELGEPIAEEITDEYVYRAYRVKTELKADFDFRDYPFDTQYLRVQLRHNTLMRENLIYVVDILGLRHDTREAILAKLDRSEAFASVGGWHVNDALYYADNLHNESTLGNPHFLLSDANIEFSRFNTELVIQRNVLSFVAKNMLPLLIILLLAYVVFYIPIRTLSPRIIISVNALLTIAFFHLRLGSDLPGIGYLIALDYAFYGIYVLIAGKLIITVLANLANEEEDVARVEKLNQFGKIAYPSLILLGVIFFTVKYDLVSMPEWVYGRFQPNHSVVAATTDIVNAAEPTADDEEVVVLNLQSWRVDDAMQMDKILDVFNARHPNIEVQFKPMMPAKYDEVLVSQLEHGIASDLFYLRSFSQSRMLYEAGYLEPLSDIEGLKENFTAAARQPWATREGVPYGVPFIAVSHAIYYNEDLFEELGLSVPETWEALEEAAITIKKAGYVPFANATGDPWTMAELIFMNLAPNFIGGKEGRSLYLYGERCFNDEHVVDAFTAVSSLAPFLPPEHESISYSDSRWLFLQGEAAMMFGGSWDVPYFEVANPDFSWSVFATPPPDGQPGYVNFHADSAIGLSANSAHKEEAQIFLSWLTTFEAAHLLGNELPGFFPMHEQAPHLYNKHANTFLELNEGRGIDVRWAWPQLSTSIPSAYELMQNGTIAVLNAEMTPEEAADTLQAGLGQWFEPAQRCGETAVSISAAP